MGGRGQRPGLQGAAARPTLAALPAVAQAGSGAQAGGGNLGQHTGAGEKVRGEREKNWKKKKRRREKKKKKKKRRRRERGKEGWGSGYAWPRSLAPPCRWQLCLAGTAHRERVRRRVRERC